MILVPLFYQTLVIRVQNSVPHPCVNDRFPVRARDQSGPGRTTAPSAELETCVSSRAILYHESGDCVIDVCRGQPGPPHAPAYVFGFLPRVEWLASWRSASVAAALLKLLFDNQCGVDSLLAAQVEVWGLTVSKGSCSSLGSVVSGFPMWLP